MKNLNGPHPRLVRQSFPSLSGLDQSPGGDLHLVRVFPQIQFAVLDQLIYLLRPILVQQNVLGHVRIKPEVASRGQELLQHGVDALRVRGAVYQLHNLILEGGRAGITTLKKKSERLIVP